jgi:hypothetical protein
MHSFNGPGDDEGRGGVVVFSAGCQLVFGILSVDHALTPAIHCSEKVSCKERPTRCR